MFEIFDTIIQQTSKSLKGFSNNDKEKETFQTAVMERKMQNIRARKNKKRVANNYKNIETFSILTNDFSIEPMTEDQVVDAELNARNNQYEQNIKARKNKKIQSENIAKQNKQLAQQKTNEMNIQIEDITNKRQQRYENIDNEKLKESSVKNELINNNLKKYISEINDISDNKIEGMTGASKANKPQQRYKNIDNEKLKQTSIKQELINNNLKKHISDINDVSDNKIEGMVGASGDEDNELSHSERYPYDASKVDIDDKNNKYTYEGHYDDDKKGNASDGDWQSKVANAIDELYEKILYVNTQLADKFADAISENNATEKDKKILKQYIGAIIAGLVSLAISYNWYNIMYVIPKEKIFSLNIKDLEELSEVPGYEIIKLLLFIFEFALYFPIKINTIITEYIPTISKKYLSGKINFLFIFGATFYGIRNLSRRIKDFFIAIVKGSSNTVLGLMLGIVVINYLVSTMQRIGSVTGIFEILTWTIPFYLVKLFIRFIIIMIVSVPVGGLLMLMYILTYSLFSMFIYPSGGILNTIKTVIMHCNSAAPEFKNNSCEDDGVFMKIFRMFIRVISLFKNQAVLIVLLYVVSNYWYILNTELSDVSTIVPGLVFKDFFNFLNILFIIPLIAWLVIGSMKIMKLIEGATHITESSTGEENATIVSYLLLLLIFFSVIYSFFGK